MSDEVLEEARRHDAALELLGVEPWIGAEPTFTRRDSQDPWWLGQPEGGDKDERARALLVELARRLEVPAVLVRASGRHYPGEESPRFAYGMHWPRGAAGQPSLDTAALEGPAFEPPAGTAVAWLTITPDPGVVEVNSAPAPDLATFVAWTRAVYGAAEAVGLSAVRFRYNGQVADAGGGGQITLGGASFETSPFFRHPQLLPRLLRYLNRHPSLSYGFASECVGSASQGPRPDEGVRERFDELGVALDWLQAQPELAPEMLWATLAPLLVDCSGNSHRAEVNVEKLANPYFGARGRLGVVELRALRMEPTPERMVAVGALLRALAVRLALSPFAEPLVDWARELHDRFALPFLLREDLRAVLADLDVHGVGLGPALTASLLERRPPLARVELGGASLTLGPAIEFWPLVGDVASQERSGARIVDASSERVEVVVCAPRGEGPGRLAVPPGLQVPLVRLGGGDRDGLGGSGDLTYWVAALRRRVFVPSPGLHPGLSKSEPLRLRWSRGDRAFDVELHSWIPGGGVYHGLPADAAEAERRRRERVVVRPTSPDPTLRPPPAGAHGGFTLDLRRL